jgi:glutathione-specific gamma-glutamylcyclotransferase
MLTRESIRSGAVRRIAADHGLMRVLSDEELATSLGGLLGGADLSRGVWVFGYGSLIWNPAFHFTDRVVGTVYGFHRRFCLWTHLGRGCPERPGLVLGLERGGSCRGVAYHIAPDAALEELDIVWRREMLSDAYVPRWVAVRTPMATVRAITFTINHAHERYARDLSDAEAAAAIAGASGFLGACADYRINTVDHLAQLGIHDRPLERLRNRVLAQAAMPSGPS